MQVARRKCAESGLGEWSGRVVGVVRGSCTPCRGSAHVQALLQGVSARSVRGPHSSPHTPGPSCATTHPNRFQGFSHSLHLQRSRAAHALWTEPQCHRCSLRLPTRARSTGPATASGCIEVLVVQRKTHPECRRRPAAGAGAGPSPGVVRLRLPPCCRYQSPSPAPDARLTPSPCPWNPPSGLPGRSPCFRRAR